MNEFSNTSRGLNIEQVLRLHNLTKDVSQFYERQLRTFLDTLGPLFRPRRLLGPHVEGSGYETPQSADKNAMELKELFARVCARPIDINKQFTTPIESISTQLQVYPW